MIPIPTRRYALAATATAALAFMLIVPTVLHLADPAFGQGTGPQGGYTPPPACTPCIQTACVGVAAPCNPSPVPTPAVPSPTPATPASSGTGTGGGTSGSTTGTTDSTGSTSTGSTSTGSTSTGTGSGSTSTGSTSTGSTSTGSTTPTPTPSTTPTAPSQPAPQAPVPPAIVLAAPPVAEVKANTPITIDIPQPIAPASLVPVDLSTPASALTSAVDTTALSAKLSDSSALAAVESDPALLQATLTGALSSQHVTGLTLTSSQDASNVQVTVKEFLPTDATQSAVTPLGDSDLSHITLHIAAPAATGGSTSTSPAASADYTALKILQIEASGAPHDALSASITFTVSQAELDLMHLSPDQVTLLHQVNGQWVDLGATLVSHVGSTYTFSAQTPSFSYFAVAAKQASTAVTSEGLGALAITGIVIAVLAVLVVVGIVVARRRQQ